jgi:hypothetical protein
MALGTLALALWLAGLVALGSLFEAIYHWLRA